MLPQRRNNTKICRNMMQPISQNVAMFGHLYFKNYMVYSISSGKYDGIREFGVKTLKKVLFSLKLLR
jgi:hypothetical protein